jgi:hypothetical protein
MSNKKIIKERLNEYDPREYEDVTMTRGLFEDLVSIIGRIPLEDVKQMTDSNKEIILLNFAEKNIEKTR